MRHILEELVAILLIVVCALLIWAGIANANPVRRTLRATNQARIEHGLHRLRLSDPISRFARRHSRQMAQAGHIFHSDLSFPKPADWTVAGENVGRGSLRRILRAFMRSPEHRANILNPRFRRIGIGVVFAAGDAWVTEDFIGRQSRSRTSMSELWWPEGYCDRYGDVRCPPAGDGPPHYRSLPTLIVVDIGLKKLPRSERRFWRRARNAALAEWEESGLTFDVRTKRASRGYRKNKITLDCDDSIDGTRGTADFGFLPDDTKAPGVGWAMIDRAWFQDTYLSRVLAPLRRVIAHEIGHTFGFGHGGTGVMSTYATSNVNEEEIEIIRNYWGLP